ncbi:nucleotidyltransferase family protein [Pseudoduganella ginsengisoli]|uniref:Nucleotidyltransferase family protein n=1 Tax=Pseudoduganella ginsengisoli TaxID=1462440 RepID=A0A6L6PYW8_9BURK|nr:nucleotidyltransferase family protein [Pseudoduganella ginsengisoli]MTW02590.1 hypothetical protein [Pseudoduganella ginsengisoli]
MTTLPLAVMAFRDPRCLAGLSAPEWHLLLRQLIACNLNARLYYMLEQRGELALVPPPVREHLEWVRVIAERHTQAALWEVRQIRMALAGIGVPLILLKGAAYTIARLPSAPGRLYSDIDILVDEAQLPDVESELMLSGWASTHHDAYDQRYYREWMHELPPMVHVHRQTAIDVHHAILPRTAPVHPDPARLRAGAVPVPDMEGVYVLAPEDMVLHSATHLFFDGDLDHGLRDLVDLDALLRHFASRPGFWAGLAERARLLQLTRPLFYALRYTSSLLGTPLPPEAVEAGEAGRPNSLLLALMDGLFHRALMPMHTSCNDRWSGTARFLIYLRGNWLRMPPLLLARHLFHKAFISPKKKDEDLLARAEGDA